jgi:hypothetical protein
VTEPAEVFIQWIEFVKNLGARPVLYHTAVGQMEPITSPEDRQARHRTLDAEEKFLTGVAQPRGAWVVPGARAHWLARGADPTVLELRWAMFPPGDCHANAVGQYLIACAFYPILTGRQIVGSPWRAVGLPSHNTGFRTNPDSPLLADTEARWLQSVAWTALTGFAKERDLGDGCVLPPAPATTALLDVGQPEPVPAAERIARNRQRRFEFLRKYWADLQANTKTKQPPVTKQAAGWMSFALKALAKDYPDVPLPPDIAAIKATFDALPEK